MSLEKLEAEALKLDPKERARLAGKLLESLEQLSEDENAKLWAEEAQRRDEEMDTHPGGSSSAEEALRDARAKLR
ncbi:Addiction module antitoxin RelB [Nitrospira tepida]|uniref:Addiction module antitoxin RelB n=1 Tax=Nitrospira tepida TaxID=2973512 RepID=A0AA86MW09_9BACT|nr:addiction module protein [Nitrospira tepida]CAI4030075.1 Addiction module antitoxin RelB [Nitrospira tepida]